MIKLYIQFIAFFILIASCSKQQDTPPQVLKARTAFANEQYQQAIDFYEQALPSQPIPLHDYLFASIAYLRQNNLVHSLRWYKLALEKGYTYVSKPAFEEDPNFYLLHTHPEWDSLRQIAYKNIARDQEGITHPALRIALDSLYTLRENLQIQVDTFLQGDLQHLQKKLLTLDSTNAKTLTQQLDSLGWLGKSKVGKGGSSMAVSLLMWSGTNCMARYEQLLEEAVKKSEADALDWAVFQDKMLAFSGKKQVFATQFHSGGRKMFPMEDFEHINEKRMALGMLPINKKYCPPQEMLSPAISENQFCTKK